MPFWPRRPRQPTRKFAQRRRPFDLILRRRVGIIFSFRRVVHGRRGQSVRGLRVERFVYLRSVTSLGAASSSRLALGARVSALPKTRPFDLTARARRRRFNLGRDALLWVPRRGLRFPRVEHELLAKCVEANFWSFFALRRGEPLSSRLPGDTVRTLCCGCRAAASLSSR